MSHRLGRPRRASWCGRLVRIEVRVGVRVRIRVRVRVRARVRVRVRVRASWCDRLVS